MEFMPSNANSKDQPTRRLLLKIMILLYQKYSEKLGVLKTLPFWLKFLENPKEHKLHFLALQMVFAALF